MKTVMREVKTVVKVQIFERGDLIVYRWKPRKANHYGIVLEDQDPNNPDLVKVRDLKWCRDSIWTGINDETADFSKCRLVAHLDDALIDVNSGNGIPIVL